ncbi:hypothetical protein ACFO25_02805 [Paenactinomyces guangxiensis]|uniref:Uncharacterized protein n=1 Tax=Paenactinomyces guangxiensis TaxID=1490290 RepID=A0A7W1WTB1_9BACL|nr:hypothetical protein [Paenactinomyces guangxiensis]MBA4495613.1 hypothetical protein [Paenactinomyces guangxiensis]MBH8592601.1 hypothetical protein [Paenactinomyces guangxiensis]
MDLMIVLFLLVLINLLIAIGRGQQRKWLRYLLLTISFLLLPVTLLFVLRAIL